MNLTDVKLLVDYHYWARDVMFGALDPLTAEQWTRPIESSFKSLRETVVHIYGAELLWYARWQGDQSGWPSLDHLTDVASVRKAWSDLEENVRGFVGRLGEPGMSRIFDYRALNGQPTSTPFWQMLQHVVNHASYHRGQITTMLRQLGAAPPQSMDLIGFYRLRDKDRQT